MGHFTYKTFCILDISPSIWTFRDFAYMVVYWI